MLDLRIDGGTVIDGTGGPAIRADVGIRNGRIVALGDLDEESARTIDARGKVVAPGFVDIHTHYDAQAFWDGTLSPSSFHGVTTVIGGNCGFSIAPLAPHAADYLMRMLARVEGMPLESLQAGVPWDWTSFGGYLDELEGRLAVNAGFLVGHSALRRVVMGERAVDSEASEDELRRMVDLLQQSIREGGLGFSSSIAATHNDAAGCPVPSRHASREEIVSLARAIRDLPGTVLEFIPGVGLLRDDQTALMTDMSLAANRPINWNVLAPTAANADYTRHQLAAGDHAAARGATVVALTVPTTPTVRINLHAGFVFDAFPGWAPMFRLSIPERMEKLRDPAFRKALDEGARSEAAGMLRGLARWATFTIDQVHRPANAVWKGRTVGELAEEQGKAPFDAMIDLALADDLKTSFKPGNPPEDRATWELRAQTWTDPRAVVGASDAGAHLDMIDTFAFSTNLLASNRAHELIPIEEAVRQLTDVPARLYGIRERGRLQEGWFADVVVFDPTTVASGPLHTREDLPGGAYRLYADAEGIEHVIVNGTEIIRAGAHTGALPGTILRSGRDTDTVEVPGGRNA